MQARAFALIWLMAVAAPIATAGKVTWGGAARSQSFVAGKAGGDLLVVFTTTAHISASTDTLYVTPHPNIFRGDGATTCYLRYALSYEAVTVGTAEVVNGTLQVVPASRVVKRTPTVLRCTDNLRQNGNPGLLSRGWGLCSGW